jgi:hypothetical protein
MRFLQLAVSTSVFSLVAAQSVVSKTLCAGKNYTYNELAGYGFVSGNARDKTGDVIGGIGSSIALDKSQWKKLKDGSYTGILYTLPDRGW